MQLIKDLIAAIVVVFLLAVLDKVLAQYGIAPSGTVFRLIKKGIAYMWNAVVEFFRENKDLIPSISDTATGSAIKSIIH